MSDAQTWTLIAGFLSLMVATLGLHLRLTKSEIRSAIAPLGERVAVLETKIDALDSDVRAVVVHLMGRPSA